MVRGKRRVLLCLVIPALALLAGCNKESTDAASTAPPAQAGKAGFGATDMVPGRSHAVSTTAPAKAAPMTRTTNFKE